MICSVLLLCVRTASSQELMKVTEVCYSVVGRPYVLTYIFRGVAIAKTCKTLVLPRFYRIESKNFILKNPCSQSHRLTFVLLFFQ